MIGVADREIDGKQLMMKMRLRRSLLFVPANRPELFDKALAGPADMICIELEDGVGPSRKIWHVKIC